MRTTYPRVHRGIGNRALVRSDAKPPPGSTSTTPAAHTSPWTASRHNKQKTNTQQHERKRPKQASTKLRSRQSTRGAACPLTRTLTRCSECGQPRPHSEQRVSVRVRGLTLGRAGLCVRIPAHTKPYAGTTPSVHSLSMTRSRVAPTGSRTIRSACASAEVGVAFMSTR